MKVDYDDFNVDYDEDGDVYVSISRGDEFVYCFEVWEKMDIMFFLGCDHFTTALPKCTYRQVLA